MFDRLRKINVSDMLPGLDVLFANPVDMVTVTRNFAVMLRAGLTVPVALDVMTDETGGRVRRVLQDINEEVQGGETLSAALEPHAGFFDPVFVTAVKVGEASGTLADNMDRVADQLERNLMLRKNIQSALLYPSIVVFVTLLLGFGMATFILPQLAGVFTSLRVELPLNTRIIIWVADVFADNGVVITLGFFGLIAALIVSVKTPFFKPVFDRLILFIPGVGGFVHDVNRARFCRSIGTLLESGVPIQEALAIVQQSLPNYTYQRTTNRMFQRIETGQSFGEIIEYYPRQFPKMIQRVAAVGEQSGGLGDVFLYLARFYENKVENEAKNFSVILEPILLVTIGAVVAFLASAIFTPIYSLLGSI